MALQSVKEYNKERYGDKFMLRDDGDSAAVTFLYQSDDDFQIYANIHYISTDEYRGYVECLHQFGEDCPVCDNLKARAAKYGRGKTRPEDRFFIPLYNHDADRIEYWERTKAFELPFYNSVFKYTPNPSQAVHRITRNGRAKDRNTTYNISAIGKSPLTYSEILTKYNIKFPDYYSSIVKQFSSEELESMLSQNGISNIDNMGEYQPIPRSTADLSQSNEPPLAGNVNLPFGESDNSQFATSNTTTSDMPGFDDSLDISDIPF